MAHLQGRGAVQEHRPQELPHIEVLETTQEAVVLIAAPVHEAISPIKALRQGAVITDPAVEVQVLEAAEAIEVLAIAQEVLPVIEVVAREGLLQEPGLLAVQVEGEGTKPINNQEFI